ncbi:MAG TPA: sugar isomerase domain-containing protein [Armatimonadota bacterium]|nr:sugar isomerase domain-containing protein [Armatimonadota bacterium]
MSAERWFERCNEILANIRTTQLEPIRQAAQLIAEAGAAGGALHFFDTGHCSHEPIHRAGGLCLLRRLHFDFTIETQAGPKRTAQASERHQQTRGPSDEQLARIGVQRSGLAPGDVLIVNSVSGKAALPVEVALAARGLGAKVVAITNVTYSRAVQSQHSSGKRLCEAADLVIDNCGVVGDAVLNMEGFDTGVAPTSGVAFCYIIWALVAEAVAHMQARGLHPHVYRSVNLPDGEQFNAQAEAAYRESGL